MRFLRLFRRVKRAPLLPVAALLAVAAGGCSQAASGGSYPKTGLAQGVVTLEPIPSPGVVLYRTRASDLQGASPHRVGEFTVVLGAGGQRWLQGARGALVAADRVAPEALLAAGVGDGPAPYWFLGQSGSVYRSETLLGPFVQASNTTPPEPLLRVSTAGGAIVGIDVRGQLLRSPDQGRTWSRVNIGGHVADVALSADGKGLLLLSPEAYYATDDAGETWRASGIAPVGGLRLASGSDAIEVLGVLGLYRWTSADPGTLKPLTQQRSPKSPDPAGLQRFGSADAVAAGTAIVDRGFYAEVVSTGSALRLWRGKATEALEGVTLNINACREPRLSGSRDALFLLCGAVGGKVTALRAYESSDEGTSFREQPYKLRGDGNWVKVLPWRGNFVWTGICDPDAEPTGCTPAGVYEATASREKTRFRELRLLGLAGPALNMTVAPVSGRLLVFGATNKGDELMLYGGDDPAAPFDVTPLPDVRLPRSAGAMVVERPAWGDDGYVSATVLETRSGMTQIVVANERGDILQLRAAPSLGAHVSGVGMRAVAVEGRSGEMWESLDGGEQWQPLGRVATELCPTARQQSCQVNLACFAQGCLISDHLTRVGWGGASDPLDEPNTPEFHKPKIELQTPIVCRVADDAVWKRVPGGQIPEAPAASLGGVDWFTHHVDWSQASVTAYEMDYAPHDATVLRGEVLFGPQSDPSKWVLFSSHQTEGVAALRGKVDGASLEVAWRNLFRDTKTHHWPLKLNGVAGTDRWTHVRTSALAQAGQPGLLSIAAGGIFVRPGNEENRAKTWLVQESGQVSELPPVIWSEIAASGRTEMSQVNGVPLALKLFRNGAALVRARLVGGVWESGAMSIGVDEPGRFNLHQSYDLTYYQGQPHYHLWQLGQKSRSWLFPLQESGAVFGNPMPIPNQAALGLDDEPRVCETTDRTSARVVAPPEAKTMHPVLVRHNSEPAQFFLTRNAVLYGLGGDACLAVYDGEAVSRDKAEESSVLARPERRQPSWVFRRATGETAFEYRRMTCEFDVNEPIPREVQGIVDDAAD